MDAPRRPLLVAMGAVIAAPLGVAGFVVCLGSRGFDPVVLAGGAIALALLAASLVVAVKLRWHGLVAIPSYLAVGALLSTYCGAQLPAPARLDAALPRATPPAEMAVFALPTGVTHRTAAFAYRGGSPIDTRDITMTAVLVKHPRGDLLIDTGLGRDIATRIEALPWWFQATTRFERTRSAAEQLEAAGYDRKTLHAILLTHAHWDHVGGIPELIDTPVWVTAAEHAHIRDGGAIMAMTRELGSVHYEDYAFEGGPYLGFATSHDVYGDGAIVVVPAPGHTPGSVIVFLALPGGKRYALIGDLVWQREGITERRERPWLNRILADADPAGVRDNLLRVAAIAARYPEIAIVPAHDARGFASMPQLPAPPR